MGGGYSRHHRNSHGNAKRSAKAHHTVPMSLPKPHTQPTTTRLAERVHRDNPQLASDAFESAKMQLLTRDFNGEWAELERKVKVHRMWGGPVPSAMLTPSADASEWEFMMGGKNGLPHRYKISQKLVGDDVPLPNTDNAIKHGESWYARPTPGQVQHSREQRRLAASRKRTLVRG